MSPKMKGCTIALGCASVLVAGFVVIAIGFNMLLSQKPTYDVALADVTWKTFTSDSLGFTFQFPADYRVWNTSDHENTDAANATENYVSAPGGMWNFRVEKKGEMSIMEINWWDYKTVDEIAAAHWLRTEPITVDGISGITYDDTESGDLYTMDYVGYAFPLNGKTLNIHFNGDWKMNDVEQYIIDSLQFTK